jgi:dihydropyrimidinase
MEKVDLIIKNGKLVIPKYGVIEGNLAVKDGKVIAILDYSSPISAQREIDAKGKFILPGVIDPHLHYGYGGIEFTEAFTTETAAATIGGVTSIITSYRQYGRQPSPYEEFYDLKKGAEARSYIDFSFYFSLASKSQLDHCQKYIEEYGVSSFKLNMAYKGEEGKRLGFFNEEVTDGFLFDSFTRLSGFPNAFAMVHCENVEIAYMLEKRLEEQGRTDLTAYSEARADFCEAESVHRVLYFSELTGCPVYIVHLSTKEGLKEVTRHEDRKGKFYVETCSHYLTHTKDSPIGVLGKVNPPFRTEEDIDALWQGLADGRIDTVGSDHCVLKKAQKKEIWKAMPGFQGTSMILPVLLDIGVNKRGIPIERIAEVSSYNTARIFGLYPKKGTIQVGSDADFAIVDLNLEKKVTAEFLQSASDFTIYEGWTTKGWPTHTIVRGEVVMEDGKIIGKKGFGRFMKRGKRYEV